MRSRIVFYRSRRYRSGFTILELLVVISVIAILLSFAVPAVQNSRESARAMQCKNQMRQFGVALHNFESSNQSLPAGNDLANNTNHSWCTRILPYLDQLALFNQYDFSKHWDDTSGPVGQSNFDVTKTSLPIFRCPSEPNSRPGGIDYGANTGTSLNGLTAGYNTTDGWEAGSLLVINVATPNPQTQPARFGEFSDGLSQTILVYECSGRSTDAGRWGCGSNSIAIEAPINDIDDDETVISRHPGGGHVLFADGHVSFLSNSMDLGVIGKLATRNRNEVVGSF